MTSPRLGEAVARVPPAEALATRRVLSLCFRDPVFFVSSSPSLLSLGSVSDPPRPRPTAFDLTAQCLAQLGGARYVEQGPAPSQHGGHVTDRQAVEIRREHADPIAIGGQVQLLERGGRPEQLALEQGGARAQPR